MEDQIFFNDEWNQTDEKYIIPYDRTKIKKQLEELTDQIIKDIENAN